MTSVNGLDGLACPCCGNVGRLLITATVRLVVSDDGADFAHGCDPIWDDDNPSTCPECGFDGPLSDYRERRLPPDPEGMNDSRAEWAGYALTAFMSQTGTDFDTAPTDLLCDLMHLADRSGTDFDAALARARTHYACETGGAEPSDSTHSNPNERTCL